MSLTIRPALRALCITALLAGTTALVGAQTPVQTPAQTRTPEEILRRYTAAIDPENRIASLEGVRTVGQMEMPAMGVSATITGVQRRPNQMIMTISIAGIGEMKQGFDGTTAWASDPMSGPRILSDAETKQMQDGANFEAMGRDPSLFTKIEAAAETVVDGEAADCVQLTWKSARVTSECYARTNGLMIESRSKQASPQGEIETVTRMYDYKPVGGVLMAHRLQNEMMGATQIITLTEVAVGPVDAKLFELPPEIKALKKP